MNKIEAPPATPAPSPTQRLTFAAGTRSPSAGWFSLFGRRLRSETNCNNKNDNIPQTRMRRSQSTPVVSEYDKDTNSNKNDEPPPPRHTRHTTLNLGTCKEQRRPSIPTSITPILSNIDHTDDDDDDDNEHGESSSQESSVVSEVTMMTYSNEMAEVIKSRFIQWMKEQAALGVKSTLQEKEAKLREIQEEEEVKMKQRTTEQLKQTSRLDNLFEKLNRLEAGQYVEEGGDGGCSEDEKCAREDGDEGRPRNNEPPTLEPRRESFARGRRSSLAQSFSSWATNKQSNSNRDLAQGQEDGEGEGVGKEDLLESINFMGTSSCTDAPQAVSSIGQQSSLSKREPSTPQQEEASHISADKLELVDELIKLKLQIANQQATIDTLSSKLHNSELANRQLQNRNPSRIRKLETENGNLAEQLKLCQTNESGLRKELNLIQLSNSSLRKEVNSIQLSNVLHEHKLAEVEEKNTKLTQENANLRRELVMLQTRVSSKRNSQNTLSTQGSSGDSGESNECDAE